MTMRCTGFCQPNSTIDEKVHRRHDQPDFREMNGRGEREKKTIKLCRLGFVLDAQRFIFIYCWCYLCEIISMLDWWTVPRPLNSSVVLSPPIAWLCGDRKYRWQINVNDNNNSEMDQNSQAKKNSTNTTSKCIPLVCAHVPSALVSYSMLLGSFLHFKCTLVSRISLFLFEFNLTDRFILLLSSYF